MHCGNDNHFKAYDPSLLATLVSLLIPSPLRILHLNLKLYRRHYSILAPLRHLSQLDFRGIPTTYDCPMTRSRQRARQRMRRVMFNSEWPVDDVDQPTDHCFFPPACSGRQSLARYHMFDPEPRWLVEGEDGRERWMNGRDAFFGSLSTLPAITVSDDESSEVWEEEELEAMKNRRAEDEERGVEEDGDDEADAMEEDDEEEDQHLMDAEEDD
jgi:hypothetical protein